MTSSPSAGSATRPSAGPGSAKTKEEALDACAEKHHKLITCFKTCSFGSAFTGCCTEEHKEFWACYTEERGTNQTRIKGWLDSLFEGSSSGPKSGQPQQAQQQQQQAQQR